MKKILDGSFKLMNSMCSIKEILYKIKGLIELSANLKGLFVKFDIKVKKKILVDSKRLTQAVLNLASNAVKFTFKGGVTLAANDETDMLKITVADTGIGIKQEEISKVFDLFGLVDTKATHAETGIGTGLYVTKYIINSMNGSLNVSSEVGKGTTFEISIPIAQHEPDNYIVEIAEIPIERVLKL